MPTITAIRSRIRESRDAHAARSALEHELSSYNSPSDLDDLHAILDRYTTGRPCRSAASWPPSASARGSR